jgi:hypothetical protein
MKDFVFDYEGANNWMDEIEPEDSAFVLFNNVSTSYDGPAVIAYQNETYKTIGSVAEFGGLVPGGPLGSGGNRAGYMALMLNYFGVNFVWTGEGEKPMLTISDMKVYPNPFNDRLNLDFGEKLMDGAAFSIFDMQGRLLMTMPVVQRHVVVNAASVLKTNGVYFYRLVNGNSIKTGKLVFNQ